jgi:hypothetical protein
MRTLICTLLFIFSAMPTLFFGCEQQDPPVRASGDAEEPPAESDEISSPGFPGTTGYYNALSGAKRTADNTKQKVDDYNRKLEEKMDDLFNE